MNRVLVFRTSVAEKQEVEKLRPVLDELVNENERWNFDLEDCDRILRVESLRFPAEKVSMILSEEGFICEELED